MPPGQRLKSIFQSTAVPGNCSRFSNTEVFGRRSMLLSELTEATGDPQIPTLPAVLNAIESRRHLDIFSRLSWRGEDLRDVQVRVLRFHSGRRCTLELVVRTAGSVRSLVGKLYAEAGLPVSPALVRIRRGGFGAMAAFSVPDPRVFL